MYMYGCSHQDNNVLINVMILTVEYAKDYYNNIFNSFKVHPFS